MFVGVCCLLRLFFFLRLTFHLLFCVFFSHFFDDILVMDGSHASSPSASFSSRDGSPHSVMEYIFRNRHYLDARRFGAMHIVGDQPLIYDRRFDMYRDTAVGAWVTL